MIATRTVVQGGLLEVNSEFLQAFMALVSFDCQVRELEVECNKLTAEDDALVAEGNVLAESRAATHKRVHDARKIVAEKELAMATLEGQRAEKQRQLESVTGTKEYAVLKTEIKRLGGEEHAGEEELLQAWASLESVQKKYASEEAACSGKVTDIAARRASIKKSINELREALSQRAHRRSKLVDVLPDDIKYEYEHMRGRVANPAVPVVHGSCSACFYAVPVQDMAFLKHGRLLLCKSCYRILYAESVAPSTVE